MSERYYLSDEERAMHADIRQHWQPMVEAAGLHHPAQDTWTVYMLGGYLMRDWVVLERTSRKFAAFKPTTEEPILREPYLAALCEMTPLEKQALRERILHATAPAQAARAANDKQG